KPERQANSSPQQELILKQGIQFLLPKTALRIPLIHAEEEGTPVDERRQAGKLECTSEIRSIPPAKEARSRPGSESKTVFPLDEGGNILNVGAFLSQLLRDLCAAGAESVQDVQSRLIINAARSLALSLEGEAHLIQNPGGEKRSLGNLHLVVLFEAVGGALSKIKVSHSSQPRFVLA